MAQRPRKTQVDNRNRCNNGESVRIDKRNIAYGGAGRTTNRRIRWCFTHPFDERDPTGWERPSDKDIDEKADWLYGQLIDQCEIFVFQLERGNTQRTPMSLQWHGYMELTSKKDHKWIKKNICDFWYLSPSREKPTQAWNYCVKLDSFIRGPWSMGKPIDTVGESKQIILYKRAIVDGMGDAELAEKHQSCFVRYPVVRESMREHLHAGNTLTPEEVDQRWSEII